MTQHLIYKSNRLVEASFRLTLLEQQIVLFAIHRARESQTGYDPLAKCEIRVSDFASFYGIQDTSNLYRLLKDALNSLFQREVSFDYVERDTDKHITFKTRWISGQMYSDGLGYLALYFTPHVVPYLTDLVSEFTRYDLKNIAQLSNVHAVRIYELAKQFETIKSRDIDLASFKRMLQLDDKYSSFAELKRRVLEPAIKQINTHTDLRLSFDVARQHRAVSSIHFKIGKARAKPVQPRLFTSKVLTEVTPLNSTAEATREASVAAIQAKADAAKAVS